MLKDEVIDLLGDDDDDIEILPKAKVRKLNPLPVPQSSTFDVLLTQLPTGAPFNKEIRPIYNCLQEIFAKSSYRVQLAWEYGDLNKYYKPSLTYAGRGTKVYTFQIVFQVSKDSKYYPDIPPRIVPQFVLPAPLMMTLYNHPVLTSIHWTAASSHKLVADALQKAVDYLEVHMDDTAMIGTSILPGDLGLVTRGREWAALPTEQLAIEVLTAELYGDYVNQINDEQLMHLKKAWTAMVVVPVRGAVKGPKKPKAIAQGRGIGYSTGHAVAAFAPVEGRTNMLLEKVSAKMDRVRALLRSQRRPLAWLLESPLPEILMAILAEHSREEIYRHNLQMSQVFSIVLSLELVLRDAWGKEMLELLPITVAATTGADEEDSEEEDVVDVDKVFDRKPSLRTALLALYHKLRWIEKEGLLEHANADWLVNVRNVSKLYQLAAVNAEGKEGEDKAAEKVVHCSDILHNHFHYRTTPNIRPSKVWLRELSFIEDNLPNEVALFASDEHPNYLVAAMTMANPDCPYYGGLFLFHIVVPAEYPNVSPKVQLVTTGDGTVRFNPNLYNCGKVCLSLLGTWQGEPWNPKASNVTQVLTSILFLIFTEDSFFNEPGFDASRHTASGKMQSLQYDWNLFKSTVTCAILYHLQKPDSYYGKSISDRIRSYYLENWTERIQPALVKKHASYYAQLPAQFKEQYKPAAFQGHLQQISNLLAACKIK